MAGGYVPEFPEIKEKIIRIEIEDKEKARDKLRPMHLVIEELTESTIRLRANEHQLEKLKALGYKIEVLWEDARDRAAYRKALMQSDDRWTSYDNLVSFMQTTATTYSDICRLYEIGTSVQGRTIYVMEITDEPDYDDPAEAEVRLIGNIHGDEYMSLELMRLMIEYLTVNYDSDPTVTDLVNNREIWIQASVNPDGHENGSRYNAHGVDLNRNHGYCWNYGGSGPFSEVELHHFRSYSLERNFTLSLSYHGETTYINYVWNFSPNPTPDEPMIDDLSYGYQSFQFDPYEVVAGWDWYQTNGDTNDWSYGCRGDIDWTIETPGYSQGAIETDWNNNRDSMLYIMEQAQYGMMGVVTDGTTGDPLEAIVTVLEHPWPVYTDPEAGDYHRCLQGGTYDIRVWANGYSSTVVTDIEVPDQGTGVQDVQLTRNFTNHAMHVCWYEVTDYYTYNYDNEAYPHLALGPPDEEPCSLGKGCDLALDMGEGFEIVDGVGDDFTVIEADVGDGDEGYTLYAGEGFLGPWTMIAEGSGTQAFDLSGTGVNNIRYLRFLDDNDGSASGSHPGFDLDAVSTIEPVPGCGILELDKTVYDCSELMGITLVDEDLNNDPGVIETVDVVVWSDSDGPKTVEMTEISADSEQFEGGIQLSETESGPGYLMVDRNDVITGLYNDADCQGEPYEAYDYATAMCPDPDLYYLGHSIDDSSGNDDGIADPGESIKLTITLENAGEQTAEQVHGILSSENEYITVTLSEADFEDIPAGETGDSIAPHFTFDVSEEAPVGTLVEFTLALEAFDFGGADENFSIGIGAQPALVIDDGGGGSPGEIADVLSNNGFVVTEESAASTEPAEWPSYGFIVWSSGGNSEPIDNSTWRSNLESYVAGGGKLLIEGGEICYDFYYSDPGFLEDVCHVDDWNSDSSGDLSLQATDHPLANNPYDLPSVIDHTYGSYYDEDACDVTSDAVIVYGWTSATGGGVIAYDDDTDPGNGGQTVFYSFTAEDISDQDERTHLIVNTARWLSGTGSAVPTATPTISPTRTPTSTPTQYYTFTPTLTPTISPTSPPTFTPTLTPTPTFTWSPTATSTCSPTIPPTDTPSSTPTYTPTGDPTDIPTEIPTEIPTCIPTMTPSVNPSITPTAPPHHVSVTIETNLPYYAAWDHFILSLRLENNADTIDVDLFIILDILQNYWFYPDWGMTPNWERRQLDTFELIEENILDFWWPTGAGSAENLVFWAACLGPDGIELASNISSTSFSYGP